MLNIKRFRKNKKLTQRELANLVGISANRISQYEKGERLPNVYTLNKIAVILDCNISDFIEDSDY